MHGWRLSGEATFDDNDHDSILSPDAATAAKQ